MNHTRGLASALIAFGLTVGSITTPADAMPSSRVPAWAAVYAGPDAGYDQVNDLAVSPDGNRVVVTGESDGGAVIVAHLSELVTYLGGLLEGA